MDDLYNKIESIETKLNTLEQKIDKLITSNEKINKSCSNMDQHISFVETTYNYIQKFSFPTLPALPSISYFN